MKRSIRIFELSLLLLRLLFAESDGFCLAADEEAEKEGGGGYAVTGQMEGMGYSAVLYNASNGLPTSDANAILSARDGYIWIGGYSGILRYDGNSFERLDASGGLSSGKALYEDSRGRLWVGTNDNGVVLLDGDESIRYTYKEGLPSSTIRSFVEDTEGGIYIGTTNGICYVDEGGLLSMVDDSQLNNEYVVRLTTDGKGGIFGNTWDGDVFCIRDRRLEAYYHGGDLGIGVITQIYPDPRNEGRMYLGTDSALWYGTLDDGFSTLQNIDISPAAGTTWIDNACGRIWVISDGQIGWLDEKEEYHSLDNIPLNSGIECMTEDYQGNLWFASSRQGVMKIVASNFKDLTEEAKLGSEVVNSTCLLKGRLYIGTDKGLQILDEKQRPVENELTEYIGANRIRCINADGQGNLWISVYSGDLGLVCYSADGQIKSYTTAEGMADNSNRCTLIGEDGTVYAASNGGMSILRNGKVERVVGAESGIANPVFLTLAEINGVIYAGTDGDGIYVINGSRIQHLGRDDGLTSDVILRIKKDEERDLLWIITSNSIEYLRDGQIRQVESFPYNNNYDIYYADSERLWVLSSYGLYCVNASDMVADRIKEYMLYNTPNGLASVPTANSFSALDEEGNLYISGRAGVSRVNIRNFFESSGAIRLGVKGIYCSSGELKPEEDGSYIIPSDAGRIQIYASVLNYRLSDPLIRIRLDGAKDDGITMLQSSLSALEFTDLPSGEYTLHISLLDNAGKNELQDVSVRIRKQPKLLELLAVRVLIVALGALLVGIIVWRIMSGTIIRRQYEQIRLAKEEAERANGAKSRFLANMSHEIRTPINTIMGMDEMILREDATDVPKPYHAAVSGYARDIRDASESLLGLINDILDLSKIESGKMNLVEIEYDTEALLRSMVTMIRVRAEQKDLKFKVQIDPALPKRLLGDMGKIKQILLNLMTNAVKYTQEGGFTLKLDVLGREEDKVLLLYSVKDTGIGVKPEDLDKLFTAFERLEEGRNVNIQGTGLGLDISRQFAELMGAELTVDSVYGEGSEFCLKLSQRIVDDEAIGEFTEQASAEDEGPYVPRFCAPEAEILVVDDNPMNLTVIKGLLAPTRVFITTAESGEECLERLHYGNFNLVLLDHMMPGMDGLETLKKIREKYTELPVIALTANAANDGEAFYRSEGFDGYLAKPVDSAALERTIMKFLPKEIVQEREPEKKAPALPALPEEYRWLEKAEGISVPDGLRYSGGPESFIAALKTFVGTLEDAAHLIENAWKKGDLGLYTVKVHALKSSARIIGAGELSELSRKLEDAGKSGDTDYIHKHTEKLLAIYRAYREKLAPLEDKEEAEGDEVPAEELKEAYAALRELVAQMDLDGVEMVMGELAGRRLPPEDAKRMAEFKKLQQQLDWDAMEELIKEV
ncbi:MAG: response regulator [Lachnospiraceae bacterium]|nr:response regulator [Lachnospiraceae bacterium]